MKEGAEGRVSICEIAKNIVSLEIRNNAIKWAF